MRYIILFIVLFCAPAFATLNEVDKTQIFSKSLLKNGGFESGKALWTASAGSFAVTGTSPMVGLYHSTWDAAASADTLTSTAVTIPAGMYGRNGVVSCLITTASGTATHTIQAYDGSNILSSVTVTSSTIPTRTSANFVFPSSGSISLRLYANADEPSIAIDDCYMGPAEGFNLGSNTVITSWTDYSPTVSNCGSSTTTYAQWRRVGTMMEIRAKIVTGTNTANPIKVSLPSGFTGNIPSGHSTSTLAGSWSTTYVSGSVMTPIMLSTELTVIQFAKGNSGNGFTPVNANVINNADTFAFTAEVPIAEWTGTVSAYSQDTTAMSWSGYHDDTCVFARTNTALGDSTADSTCTLTERTNRNFGTVTSYLSGSDKLPGIVFTPKRAGRYLVLVSAEYLAGANSHHTVQLLNGSTALDACSQLWVSSGYYGYCKLTGIVDATSTSSITLKLYTAASSGAITLQESASGANTGSAIEWQIIALDQSFPGPVLTDSPWSADETLTFTAETSGTFAKGTNTTDFIRYQKIGKFALVQFQYVQTGAGSNGVGDILITLPGGLSADTTRATVCTSTTDVDCDYAALLSTVGSNFGAGTNAFIGGKCVLYSATKFRCIGYAGGSVYSFWGANSGGLANANTRFGGWLQVPISGW
jgi:hypothetical protein